MAIYSDDNFLVDTSTIVYLDAFESAAPHPETGGTQYSLALLIRVGETSRFISRVYPAQDQRDEVFRILKTMRMED